MDYQLQVITVSVSDVDRAAAFYTQQAGFTLDVDYHPASGFRVMQLTPPGSACSVQIGTGLTDAPPGSARAIYLAVTDIEAARQELTGRGVTVSGIRHKSPVDDWTGGFRPGTDPQRRDYASFADFADPDGNTWIIQEIGHRPPQDVTDIILDAARDAAATP
jgi:catechol 2,3-dioxygenase-like lactoylglutathione lyase family enzyme